MVDSDATSSPQDASSPSSLSSHSVWAATLRGPHPQIYGGGVWYDSWRWSEGGETLLQLLSRQSRESRQRVSRRPLSLPLSLRVPPPRGRVELASGTLHLHPFDLDTTPPPGGAWAPRPADKIIDSDQTLPSQDAVWAGRAARFKPFNLHP